MLVPKFALALKTCKHVGTIAVRLQSFGKLGVQAAACQGDLTPSHTGDQGEGSNGFVWPSQDQTLAIGEIQEDAVGRIRATNNETRIRAAQTTSSFKDVEVHG